MKFAHLADCHLGGWRQPELKELNLQSFKKAIDTCIEEKVEFVLIAGDLFDSAYPPVEILEETFLQLKRLKDKNIEVYLVAGSHDYSASGKTFLSVLEKAGFCKNLYQPEEKNTDDKTIFLNPTIHKTVALYGYPGKKSGLEVDEIRKIKLQESPGFFKVFALHTCVKGAIGSLPIDSLDEKELPESDYYALGHLHVDYNKGKFVYSGPVFPNNFEELEELGGGSFYIVETYPSLNPKKIELKIKEIEKVSIEVKNGLTATDQILLELSKRDLKDKIVLLRVYGKLVQGKTRDINFQKVEVFAKEKQACILLKSTSKLETEEAEINVEIENMDKLEEEIITKYSADKSGKFNDRIMELVNVLALEKQEGETSTVFNSRLFLELNKVLKTEMI